MSGYQVQTPGTFTASSIASPFNPIDNLQNEQIYNLQQFKTNVLGNALFYDYDGPYGGDFFIPESALDPSTPYEMTIQDLCTNYKYIATPTNTAAYSVNGGGTTGPFQTGSVKTYYVSLYKGIPWLEESSFPESNEWYKELYQNLKGTYGWNQIPIGIPFQIVQVNIGRGTAIVFGAAVPNTYPDSIPAANANYSFTYEFLYVNQMDHTGAPLRFNVQASTEYIIPDNKNGMRTVAGKTITYNVAHLSYESNDDLWFSTFYPEEYNTPAIRCPRVKIRPDNVAWPTPL